MFSKMKKKLLTSIPKYIWDCLTQYFTTVIYSLAPLLIGAAILSMMDNGKDYFDGFIEQAAPGELILWSATVIAGVAYSIIKDPPVKYRGFFGFYCLIVLVVATIYKALTITNESIADLTLMAYVLAISTALVLFANMFMEMKAHSNPSKMLRAEGTDFADGYANRRTR